MKPLIILLLAILALSCEPEEIIKYVDKPVYITNTITTTDTVETVREVPVYHDSIVYVEVTVTDTIVQNDTIVELRTRTVVLVDTIEVETFVYVTDTVYIDRSADISYHPDFDPYVQNFYRMQNMDHALPVNVFIDYEPPPHSGYVDSYGILTNNTITIMIRPDECYEAAIYRELMHYLFLYPYHGEWNVYIGEPNDIMTKNWPICLEDLSDQERHDYIVLIFPNYLTIDYTKD